MFKRFWWVFLVMLPVGALAGLLVAAVVTYVMPKKYESEATIEVRPRAANVAPFDRQSTGSAPVTPQFFGTEFEKIKSRKTLEKVVENLDLTNRWMVDKETAIRILKGVITTQNIRGTDLISIRVRHTNKVDARDITQEVANAYKEYRSEIEVRAAERVLHELNKAVRDQEDKVEERRKVLSTIARTKGIVYRGNDSLYGSSGADDDQGGKRALQEFHQLEQEKMQLESQISSLLKYDNEQLMVYASGLDHPDNIVKELYPQYQEEKRQVEGMKINGLSDAHPTVRAANENIAEMKLQLDEGIVNLRATLTAQLDRVSKRLDPAQSTKRDLDAHDYVDAKRDFETDRELLQMMKIKQMGETIAGKVLNESVDIHNSPVTADLPVSPNITLNLTLGTVLGMLLSPLMALPVMWFLNRAGPAKA